LFVPSHWSSEHGLPSEVQLVPLGFLTSAGQLTPEPLQLSAWSHSSAAGRQTPLDAKPSAGQAELDPVQVSATSQRPAVGRHVWPPARNWQVEVQQDVELPFATPRSHCSPTDASIVPLPHREVNDTVTKCPSFDWVREGMPSYSQAPQLVVDPFCSPCRIPASHELLRTEPFHVNVSEWLCATLLLVRKITAELA